MFLSVDGWSMLGKLLTVWLNVLAMIIVSYQPKIPLKCNLGSGLFVLSVWDWCNISSALHGTANLPFFFCQWKVNFPLPSEVPFSGVLAKHSLLLILKCLILNITSTVKPKVKASNWWHCFSRKICCVLLLPSGLHFCLSNWNYCIQWQSWWIQENQLWNNWSFCWLSLLSPCMVRICLLF